MHNLRYRMEEAESQVKYRGIYSDKEGLTPKFRATETAWLVTPG